MFILSKQSLELIKILCSLYEFFFAGMKGAILGDDSKPNPNQFFTFSKYAFVILRIDRMRSHDSTNYCDYDERRKTR